MRASFSDGYNVGREHRRSAERVMRVLIVGAGPTGLTAALELARRGIDTKIVDRRAEGSGLSRAVGIMPASLEILKPCGVSERLLAEGIRMADFHFFLDARKLLSFTTRRADPKHDFLLALPQDRTEAVMRNRLAERRIKVAFGTTLAGFEQSSEGVTAAYADRTTERFDYLIGADGMHSTTRRILGVAFNGYDLPETWSIADVEACAWPYRDSFVVSALRDGRVAVVAHIGEERYRVISNTPDALATLALPLDVSRLHRQGTFGISVRQVDDYQVGRVLLAGDAAHCHSPVGGRGMNLGIADAAELAQRLADGELSGYSASRHRAGKAVIAASEGARKIVTSGKWSRRMLFRLGLTAVRLLPPLKRHTARVVLRG
jgi:2-polyprenyl-6-methoxyphenol hydroxylase-like FAD-dependent oxidoreductase